MTTITTKIAKNDSVIAKENGTRKAIKEIANTIRRNIDTADSLQIINDKGHTYTCKGNLEIIGRGTDIIDGKPVSKTVKVYVFENENGETFYAECQYSFRYSINDVMEMMVYLAARDSFQKCTVVNNTEDEIAAIDEYAVTADAQQIAINAELKAAFANIKAEPDGTEDKAEPATITYAQYTDLHVWAEKISNGQRDIVIQIKTHLKEWLNVDADKTAIIDIIAAEDLNGFRRYLSQFNFIVKDDAGYLHKLVAFDNGECVLGDADYVKPEPTPEPPTVDPDEYVVAPAAFDEATRAEQELADSIMVITTKFNSRGRLIVTYAGQRTSLQIAAEDARIDYRYAPINVINQYGEHFTYTRHINQPRLGIALEDIKDFVRDVARITPITAEMVAGFRNAVKADFYIDKIFRDSRPCDSEDAELNMCTASSQPKAIITAFDLLPAIDELNDVDDEPPEPPTADELDNLADPDVDAAYQRAKSQVRVRFTDCEPTWFYRAKYSSEWIINPVAARKFIGKCGLRVHEFIVKAKADPNSAPPKEYVYFMKTDRPLFDGIPKGWVHAQRGHNIDTLFYIKGCRHPVRKIFRGMAIYNRPLSDREILDYDLVVMNESNAEAQARVDRGAAECKTVAAIAEQCRQLNDAAPDGWEVSYDSEHKNFPVKFKDKTVATLDTLALQKILTPEKFFAQFRSLVDENYSPKQQFLDDLYLELDRLEQMRAELGDDTERLKTIDAMIEDVKQTLVANELCHKNQ